MIFYCKIRFYDWLFLLVWVALIVSSRARDESDGRQLHNEREFKPRLLVQNPNVYHERLLEALEPTSAPTGAPSSEPTARPTGKPTILPTAKPTAPTRKPTVATPTSQPTCKPSSQPTRQPSSQPTCQPSSQPSCPTGLPTSLPTGQPTLRPTVNPSFQPTSFPTSNPTSQPTMSPSGQPTRRPTSRPTRQPTSQPSVIPTGQPSGKPSVTPSSRPTNLPTAQPSRRPTGQPTRQPTRQPTSQPTSKPSGQPTSQPSRQPTGQPTRQPTRQPTGSPSGQPSVTPTSHPTTSRPTSEPSGTPTQYPNTSPPTNVGITNKPSQHPTSNPTVYLDDYKYKQIYGMWSKYKKQLPLEIKPDNGSVIGSIYFDYLDYKGFKWSGDCDAWNEFRTKAINLPFDNLHPSYIKSIWGTENYTPGKIARSVMIADCNDRTMLQQLFQALMSADPKRRFTGRCIATNGVFHDWRVYSCSGRTIFCVDCKFACSDQSCPGKMPSIVNSCDTSCKTQMGAFLTMRVDIEQSVMYPVLSPLSIVASDNSFEVRSTLTEPASIYCAALDFMLNGSPPVITSIYQVKKQPGPGIGFTMVSSVSGVQQVSIFIYGLSRSKTYKVFCYSEDASLHGMDFNAVGRTGVTAQTTGSNTFQISMPSFIFTGGRYDASSFSFLLDNAPIALTYFIATVNFATVADGCDSSKVTIGGNSVLPTIQPNIFEYSAESSSSSKLYNFLVRDGGTNGCFKITINQAKSTVNVNSGIVTYVPMPSTDSRYVFNPASKIIQIVNNDVLLTFPTLTKATFSRDALYLEHTFSADTNRALPLLLAKHPNYRMGSAFNCSLIIVFTGSDDAQCQWLTDSFLRAKLSSAVLYPTIGEKATLRANIIKAACKSMVDPSICARYTAASTPQWVTIDGAANPIAPEASLNTAPSVGLCDNVILDATQSSGNAGKDWTSVSWLVRAADPSLTTFSSYLNPWTSFLNSYHASVKEFILLPKSISGSKLPLNMQVMIILTLSNHLGLSASTSTSFLLRNETLVPNLRIGGPVLLRKMRSEALSLFALASIPACAIANETIDQQKYPLQISYQWGTFRGFEFMQALPSTSNDPKVFRIEPYSLEPGFRYSITVLATVTKGLLASTSLARVVVDVTPAGVKALIVGGSSRTISLAYDLITMDGSPSVDLDYPDGKYDTDFLPDQGLLSYNWTCVEYAPTFGNACEIPMQNKNRAILSIDTTRLAKNSTISTGVSYKFTLTVTSRTNPSLSDATTTIARVIGQRSGPAVSVQVKPLQVKYNVDEKIVLTAIVTANRKSAKPVLFQWSCEQIGSLTPLSLTPYQTKLSLGINPSVNYDFAIKPNSLMPGFSYTFVLRAAYQEASTDTRANPDSDSVLVLAHPTSFSETQVEVKINSAPTGGSLIVTPTSGTALTTIFSYLGRGWIDDAEDLPIMYSFGYYKTSRTRDSSLLSSISEIPSSSSILPEGFSSTGRSITIFMTVQDLHGARVEVEKVITVNAQTDITVYNNFGELSRKVQNDLDLYFRMSSSSGIWHTINAAIPIINKVDCDGDPGPGLLNPTTKAFSTCANLNREKCTIVTNTCGPCLSGYVGVPGHSNSKCSEPNTIRAVGASCQDDSQCFANNCQNGVCSDPPKKCPDNCGSFQGKSSGSCVYYKGNAIGKMLPLPYVKKRVPPRDDTPDQPGTGVDDDAIFKPVKTAPPTSFPTPSPYVNPYTVAETCTASDGKCSAVCECNFGFYGSDCRFQNATMKTMLKMRERMCTALSSTIALQDPTLEVIHARFSIVTEILQDLTQITAFALQTCTQVLLQTISDAPIVVSHDTVIHQATSTLTHILSLGTVLRPELIADIEAALENLSVAKQEVLAIGEQGVGIVNDKVSMYVSKIRFGGGNDLGDLSFSIPPSDLDIYLGRPTASVELLQRVAAAGVRRSLASSGDVADSGISTVIGISFLQYKNNPSGLQTNSTPVQLKAFFYEGEAAGLRSIGNTTYQVTLQNREKINYEKKELVVLNEACYPKEKPYDMRVTCPDNSSTIVECIGEYYYGYRRVNCPTFEQVPLCLMYDGYGYMRNPHCHVSQHNEYSTTCVCDLTGTSADFIDPNANTGIRRSLDTTFEDVYGTNTFSKKWENRRPAPKASYSGIFASQKHRLMTTQTGWVKVFEFASFWEIQGTNFESIYIPSGTQIVELVFYDKSLLTVLVLWGAAFAIGIYVFGIWDLAIIRANDPKYNDTSKIIPTVRNFAKFFDDLLPKEFAQTTALQRFKMKLLDEHDWLVMLLPGWSKDRDLRTVKWLMVCVRILNFMVAATILVRIFYWDNGDCQKLLDAETCETPKAMDGWTDLCWWSYEQRSCAFRPIKKRFAPCMIMTICMVIMTALPDKLCNFFAKQAKRSVERFYLGPGFQLTADQELGDEMKDYQERKSTILRAARFIKQKADIDFVNAEQELANMLKVSNSTNWMPRDHQTSQMGNFLRTIAHEAKNARILLDDIGDPRTASDLMHHALSGSRKLIIKKIQQSRRRAEVVKARMAIIPLDMDKDNYLIKRFLADSLPGFRRKVAQHFLFIRTEVEERFAQQPTITLKISMLFYALYLVAAVVFVIYMSTILGFKSSELWMLAVMCATIQDIFVVQPIKIYIKYILVIDTIREEMMALFSTFKIRAKTLIRRRRGLMTNISSLVQHFNPACRAARMYPHLPSARLIMSLTDFDLPIAHNLEPIVPERRFRNPAITGVGETPNASNFVTTRASPLFYDLIDILLINLHFAALVVRDEVVKLAYALMGVSMHLLMKFNDVLQNVFFECIATLIYNIIMLLYFFAQNSSNTLLFVCVALTVLLMLYPIYRAKVLEEASIRARKERIALHDAIRTRRYYKKYLADGTFHPGDAAREKGIYFKEEGAHARNTYQKGTGDFNEEEQKLANEIFYEKGLLPYTAKLEGSPDIMGKHRSRPKEEKKKASTKEGVPRQPYDTVSNVYAMKKSKKAKSKDSRVHPDEASNLPEAIPIDDKEPEPDVVQSVLQRIKKNAGGLIDSMLTISWGKLGQNAAGGGADVKSGSDIIKSKSGVLVVGAHEGSSFESLEGPPLAPVKRDPPKRGKSSGGSVGYGDVLKVDTLHAMTQQSIQGSSKKNMALTLAQAQSGKFDLAIDLDAMKSTDSVKRPYSKLHKGESAFDLSQSMLDDDSIPDFIAPSVMSLATGKTGNKSMRSHITLYDSDGNERYDDDGQEGIAHKIKKASHKRERKVEEMNMEANIVEVKGPGETAHKIVKAGHVVDHKAQAAKHRPGLEEPDNEDPSKPSLILPLRAALHELAVLKVLNPGAGQIKLSQTDVDVKYKNDVEQRKVKAAGGDNISVVSAKSAKSTISQEEVVRSSNNNPNSFKALRSEAFNQAAGTAEFDVIREKGRTVQYSRLKDKKSKVVNRLIAENPEIGPGDGAPEPYLDLNAHSPDHVDVAHRVYLTGVGFLPPENPPEPIRPVPPKKVVQDPPAKRINSERVEEPKFPLFH